MNRAARLERCNHFIGRFVIIYVTYVMLPYLVMSGTGERSAISALKYKTLFSPNLPSEVKCP